MARQVHKVKQVLGLKEKQDLMEFKEILAL
jgi:hypothetical protein